MSTVQELLPDWSETKKGGQIVFIAKDGTVHDFKGPGIYHVDGATVLIVPKERNTSKLWAQAFKDDEVFRVYCWINYNPFYESALGFLTMVPTRTEEWTK